MCADIGCFFNKAHERVIFLECGPAEVDLFAMWDLKGNIFEMLLSQGADKTDFLGRPKKISLDRGHSF